VEQPHRGFVSAYIFSLQQLAFHFFVYRSEPGHAREQPVAHGLPRKMNANAQPFLLLAIQR
jgi:hypothetical protein